MLKFTYLFKMVAKDTRLDVPLCKIHKIDTMKGSQVADDRARCAQSESIKMSLVTLC